MIWLFIILIILMVLLAIYVYKESIGYHKVYYNISDSRVQCEKLTFVFLSDMHNKMYGANNSELLADIDEINPDYVVIGGDMITSCLEHWNGFNATLEFINKLSKRYKVIYGMGNHEERLRRKPEKFPEGVYEKLSSRLAKMGCPILVNECVKLDCGIDVYGLDLAHKYYRKFVTKKLADNYLTETLGILNPDRFSILLAHNPEHFKSYAKWGADLVLSGHVHGGIIRLPYLGGVVSPALKLFPKYDGGKFEEGDSIMILSRGLGSHTIPIRVNNKAELVVIEITGKKG